MAGLELGGSAAIEPSVDVLANGLRVAVTAMPHSQAAVSAAYVGVGSRDEARATLGLSHYLEHMLFKGTESRPEPTAISEAIEGAGGSLNAFTSQEVTCFYNIVPFHRVEQAADVLADSLRHSLLAAEEMERERTVINSELRRAHDQPGQRAGQLVMEATYGEQPLGWEIGGDLESVAAITREDLQAHIAQWYRPQNMVLSVAGNVEREQVLALAERYWGQDWPEGAAAAMPSRERATDGLAEDYVRVEERELEQCSLMLQLRALPRLDPDRYALSLLNEVLGGGMSSRLFVEIREKRGLAYAVGSYPQYFQDTGHLAVMAGVTAEHVLETTEVILEELERMAQELVLEGELERVREHTIGSFLLGMDGASSWCHRAGGSLLQNGRIEPVAESLAGLAAVTREDIQRVAQRIMLEGNVAAAVVGSFSEREALQARIAQFASN